MHGALRRFSPIIAGQVVLAIMAMLLLAIAPPAHGRMLLVPLGGKPVTQAMIRTARATPLRPGPMQGSWVVDGQRSLLSDLISQGIVVLAAPGALCESPASSEDPRS